MKFLKIILTLLSFTTLTANAGIPDEYSPVVIEPPFSFSKRLIDLTESVNKSKATGKPILLYFGAADCPPPVNGMNSF